jgi:hypothetical protein
VTAIALFFLAAVIAIGTSNIADAIRESNSAEDDEDENENDKS